MVVFTYAISDFGIPKVIGGNFNMLATDIFKLVIGQQDFSKGAVVGIILLLPVAVTYVAEGWVQRRQSALLSARSVPYVPRPSRGFDWAMTAYCTLIGLLLLAVLGMAVYASFVKLWPYNFSMSLDHYRMGLVEAGMFGAYIASVTLGFWCATLGAAFIFAVAYLLEKTRGLEAWRPFVRLMAVLPMGIPGMVLGAGLHLLLRRGRQPAALPLRDDGDPGAEHRGALLHLLAPHRGDRAEADRQRVRVGLGLAQGAVLAHVLHRHAAGVPALDARHQPLPVRERDDDRLGGGVPVLAEDDARVGGDREPGRGRRHRRRGGDGDAGGRHFRDGLPDLLFPAALARPPDPGLAAVELNTKKEES
jgi:ABC-type spermidine/putrescine transport system permease subunit II